MRPTFERCIWPVCDGDYGRPIDWDTSAPVDVLEQTASAGESTLSDHTATGEYTYVWKTEKAWDGTCRQLVVKLDDSTVHRTIFAFR